MRALCNLALHFLVCSVLVACSLGQDNPNSPQPVTASQLNLPLLTTLPPVTQVGLGLVGNPGTSTNFYWIVTNYTFGQSSPQGPFVITNAPGVLSSSNYVTIAPQYLAGATVDVLKTTSANPPSGTGSYALSTGNTSGVINDQGGALSSYTVAPASPGNYGLCLANQVTGLGASHLILGQGPNCSFVADLSIVGGTGITGSGTIGNFAGFTASTVIGNAPCTYGSTSLQCLGGSTGTTLNSGRLSLSQGSLANWSLSGQYTAIFDLESASSAGFDPGVTIDTYVPGTSNYGLHVYGFVTELMEVTPATGFILSNALPFVEIYSPGGPGLPQVELAGTLYTGGSSATNFPALYQSPAGTTEPTTFSTAGTLHGINAPSGFTGNFQDYYINGTTRPWFLNYQGYPTIAGCVSGTYVKADGTGCATPSGGTITGSGTVNTIPLWTGSTTTLGNSPLTIAGGDVVSGDPVSAPSFIGTGPFSVFSALPGSACTPSATGQAGFCTGNDGNWYVSQGNNSSTTAGSFLELATGGGVLNQIPGLQALGTGATTLEAAPSRLYVDGTPSTFLSSNAAVASSTCGAATGTYGANGGCEVYSMVPETFNTNPFFTPGATAVKKGVHLYLGAGDQNFTPNVPYLTNSQIIIPAFSTLSGIGRTATTIALGPDFPQGTPPPTAAPTLTLTSGGSLSASTSYIAVTTYVNPNGETDQSPVAAVTTPGSGTLSFSVSTPTTLTTTSGANSVCDSLGGYYTNGTPCGWRTYVTTGELATATSAVAIGATSVPITVNAGSAAFPNSGTATVITRTLAPFHGVPTPWAFTWNCGGACGSTLSGIAASGVGSIVATIRAGDQIYVGGSFYSQGGLNGNGSAMSSSVGNLSCSSCTFSGQTNGLTVQGTTVSGEVVGSSGSTSYTYTLTQGPITAGSISVTDGTHTCNEGGVGVFNAAGTCAGGSIDYNTGVISPTFTVATTATVTASYTPGQGVLTHNESGAVVRLGLGQGTQFAARIENMEIDCYPVGASHGLPYTIGVIDESAQEQSGAYRVFFKNCTEDAGYWNTGSVQDTRIGDQLHVQGPPQDTQGVLTTITANAAIGATSLTVTAGGSFPTPGSTNRACDATYCTAMIFVGKGMTGVGAGFPILYTGKTGTTITGIPATGYGSITTANGAPSGGLTVPGSGNNYNYVGTPSYLQIFRVENTLGIRGADDLSIAGNSTTQNGPNVPIPVGFYILNGVENKTFATPTVSNNGLYSRLHFENTTEGVRLSGGGGQFDSLTGADTTLNGKPNVVTLFHGTANTYDWSAHNIMSAQQSGTCPNGANVTCVNLLQDDVTTVTLNSNTCSSETGNLAFYAIGGTGQSRLTTDPCTASILDGLTLTTPLSSAGGGTGLNASASTGVLQDAAGTMSVSTALANGTTATTQGATDNTTKVASDQFVNTAVTNGLTPSTTVGNGGIWNAGIPLAGQQVFTQTTTIPGNNTLYVQQLNLATPLVLGHAAFYVTVGGTAETMYVCLYNSAQNSLLWTANGAVTSSTAVVNLTAAQYTAVPGTYYLAYGQTGTTGATAEVYGGTNANVINIENTNGKRLSTSSTSVATTPGCPASINGTLSASTAAGAAMIITLEP